MQSITKLAGRHIGSEAWIFGKGPSLDRFEMSTAGTLRICINESLSVVPTPTYFFAHDERPIERVAVAWPAGCIAILQSARASYAIAQGISSGCVFTYEKCEGKQEVLSWSAEQIALKASLLGLTGTVHSAIHFCKLIGVVSLVFVGMDGGPDYARCIRLPPTPGGGRHDLIRRDSIKVAERLRLPYRFVE